MFFLMLFIYFSNSYMFYWFFFLLMTMLMVVTMLNNKTKIHVVLNYFFFQEFLGMLFILNFGFFVQSLILMVKLGIPPFYYWVIIYARFFNTFLLSWFLLWSKMSYLPLMGLFFYEINSWLFMGILMVYFHLYLINSLKVLVILSSLESFCWMILIMNNNFFGFFLIGLFYLLFMVFLFSSSLEENFSDFFSSLFIFSFPFNIVFFVKYLGLMEMDNFLFWWVLVLMFLSLVSLLLLFYECFLRFNLSSVKGFLLAPSLVMFLWFLLL